MTIWTVKANTWKPVVYLIKLKINLKNKKTLSFDIYLYSIYRVSHETWPFKSFKCLHNLIQNRIRNITWQSLRSKIDFKAKYIWEKYFVHEINCKQSLISNILYGKRHSPTVLFLWTPCISGFLRCLRDKPKEYIPGTFIYLFT